MLSGFSLRISSSLLDILSRADPYWQLVQQREKKKQLLQKGKKFLRMHLQNVIFTNDTFSSFLNRTDTRNRLWAPSIFGPSFSVLKRPAHTTFLFLPPTHSEKKKRFLLWRERFSFALSRATRRVDLNQPRCQDERTRGSREFGFGGKKRESSEGPMGGRPPGGESLRSWGPLATLLNFSFVVAFISFNLVMWDTQMLSRKYVSGLLFKISGLFFSAC